MEQMERFETLTFERDGHVGRLTLDRPDRLNAFSVQMWDELARLGARLVDDAELRALVVIGRGRAFSSGIDTSVFTEGTGAQSLAGDEAGRRDADPAIDGILRAQQSYSWLEQAPYPTIAAVRGYAFGAGLQLALACDLRVFARGTRVGLLEHRYGILPDLGGTQRLPRVVGEGKAKELIWTAARIDAEEAYRIGLCERLVDDARLEDEVHELAGALAAQPPLAVQGAKRAVAAAADLPIGEGLRVEAREQAGCLRSEDMREAIAAFVEQRPPVYRGR